MATANNPVFKEPCHLFSTFAGGTGWPPFRLFKVSQPVLAPAEDGFNGERLPGSQQAVPFPLGFLSGEQNSLARIGFRHRARDLVCIYEKRKCLT
jgi:hypothetical protein